MSRKRYNDLDYVHISVALRIKEGKLLKADDFDRMAESQSADEAFRYLAEKGYSFPDGVVDPLRFEDVLSCELASVYAEIKRITSVLADINPSLLSIFRLQYDFMNIKALLKEEILDVNSDGMLSECGNLSKYDMKSAFINRDKNILGSYVCGAIEESINAFSEKEDPQVIDLICDKFYFKAFVAEAEKSGFDFLKKYAGIRIDITNCISYLRTVAVGKQFSFYENSVFIDGGMPVTFYKDKENKTKSDFLSGYKYTALEKFSIIPEEEISFAKLEAVSDEITGDFIAELRCVPFGAETVVSYLLSKEAEIKNTRIVMSGKLAGLAPDKIRERLRFSYV